MSTGNTNHIPHCRVVDIHVYLCASIAQCTITIVVLDLGNREEERGGVTNKVSVVAVFTQSVSEISAVQLQRFSVHKVKTLGTESGAESGAVISVELLPAHKPHTHTPQLTSHTHTHTHTHSTTHKDNVSADIASERGFCCYHSIT